jgi:predicted molibdopterin-dependent oxidoreductase YjgC
MAEVTIIVDGKKLQAAAGSLLIDVYKRTGIEIPSFCYYRASLSMAPAASGCMAKPHEQKPVSDCPQRKPKLVNRLGRHVSNIDQITSRLDEISLR